MFFNAQDGTHGLELWTVDSNGQEVMLADIQPGDRGSVPADFAALPNGQVLVGANDGTSGAELWTTDGTPAGTRLLADINPGSEGSNPRELTVVNGVVYFRGFRMGEGYELRRSDGTESGTSLVYDAAPGPNGSVPMRLDLLPVGDIFYYAASLTPGQPEHLLVSDGTPAGTREVQPADPANPPRGALALGAVGGRAVFTAIRADVGFELFHVNGSGQRDLLADIRSGNAHSTPGAKVALGSSLFFSATDDAHGTELWRTDGAPGGTEMVIDLCPGTCNGAGVTMIAVGGLLFFVGDDGTTGDELFVTDGTAGGTRLVSDIGSGILTSSPRHLTAAGSLLYFVASEMATGAELWVSDGTDSGTRRITDIVPGAQGSLTGTNPDIIVATSDGTVWFRALASPGSMPTLWCY